MIKSKFTSMVCITIVSLLLIITFLLCAAGNMGITVEAASMPYEKGLFSTDTVHTMDIIVDEDGLQEMLDNASSKEYINVNLIIDGDAITNVALRTKGNSSLSSIVSSESDRYSFKVEFDHYTNGQTFQGLDKLALNNIAQDNTYLKDYISYQLMSGFGVDSPLCSFIYITVNGEDWGLYLAVEGIEESFAERNYGTNYGEIYKPDSMSMMGKGDNNNMADRFNTADFENGEMPEGFTMPGSGNNGTAEGEENSAAENAESKTQNNKGGFDGMGGMGGSSDVALQYIDEEISSYSNIFDNAVLDPDKSDKTRLISSIKQLSEGENIEEVVNTEEVLRYFVVHNYLLNFDSYTGSMTHNYYLYEEDGKLSMIAWDYNLAFGAFAGMGGGMDNTSSTSEDQATTMVNYPIDDPMSGVQLEDRPMISWIFESEEYLTQYHELFSEFISDYFDTDVCTAIIDNAVELISPYVEKDPSAFCTYEEFIAASADLREFCQLRAESISGQLDGSIPSTSEGQSEDSSSFIDASSIDLTAMGSNSMGFGNARGGMDRGGPFGNNNQTGDSTSNENPPSTDNSEVSIDTVSLTASAASITQISENGAMPNDGDRGSPPQGMEFPEGEMPEGMVPPADGNQNGEIPEIAGEANEENPAATPEPSPDENQSSSSEQPKDNAETNENTQNNGRIQNGMMGGFNRMDNSQTSTASNTDIYVLLGISFAILIFGIIFAKAYKV